MSRFLAFLLILSFVLPFSAAQLQSGSPWPRFQGNVGNTGLGVGSGANGAIRWTYSGAAGFAGSVVIDKNNIVYGSDTQGNIFALDGSQGTVLWTGTLPGTVDVAPALDSTGHVLFVDSTGTLTAVRTSTGSQDWSFQVPSKEAIECAPVIDANANIYFGCDDGVIYAFSESSLAQLWKMSLATSPVTSLAIRPDGTLCINDYFGEIDVINATTEAAVWSYLGASNGNSSGSAPLILSDGSVVFNTNGNVWKLNSSGALQWQSAVVQSGLSVSVVGPSGDIYAITNGNELEALHPDTGVQEWEFTAGGNISTNPVVGSDGTIYFGANDGNLYAINPSGNQLWTANMGGGLVYTPAIGADGTLYFGDTGGIFYAIDATQVKDVYASPSSVVGGHSTSGVVQLTAKAGPLGELVDIASNSAAVVPTNPVLVPAGKTGVSFAITTYAVSTSQEATITATIGQQKAQGSLTVNPAPLSNFYISPTSITGGATAKGVVQISGPTGPSGDAVSLGILSGGRPSQVQSPSRMARRAFPSHLPPTSFRARERSH